jgi:TRAP-type C4-dicarboxylate transport system substrate-binding protein
MRSPSIQGHVTMRAVGLALVIAASLTGTAAAQEEAPITLRLGVADGLGRASTPSVEAFVDAAAAISDGAITIEPIFQAASDPGLGAEKGTARLLAEGGVELALSASRAWEHVGIESFKALQSPFLIDSDELAIAVAMSPVANRILDGMSASGLTGLAMWPEDLRHPVSFDQCTDPLVTPEAFEGLTIRALDSTVTYDLLKALGATPIYEEFDSHCAIAGAESGLGQAGNLPHQGTFVGDVTFFPKYQVLAANTAAFDRLTASQQAAIRAAARSAQQLAIAEHPSDAEAATAWCESGGSVALAGTDGIAAFRAAAEPVSSALAAEPATADAIVAISALKETVAAGPAIKACDPGHAPADPPVAGGGSTPIDGTWIASITYEELAGYCCLLDTGEINDQNWGDITITFDAGAFSMDLRNPRDEYHGSGTFEVEGDALVLLDENACCPVEPFGMRWTLEGDTLTLSRSDGKIVPSTYVIKPWIRLPG